jgi:hypothetical protein
MIPLLLTVGLSVSNLFAVQVHPVPAEEGVNAPFQVTAGETLVPLERVGAEGHPVYYARFMTDGPVPVQIAVEGKGDLTAEVKPARYVKGYEINGSRIAFQAEGPGPRIVFAKRGDESLPLLFVIYEPQETNAPDPAEEPVLDVRDFDVEAGDSLQTKAFQKALDTCGQRPGGGILYVPEGTYRTGTLKVPSNVHLYLAGGAILQAIDDPAAYPIDAGDEEHGGNGRWHSNSRLLMFENVENAGLFGRGTLDANGPILRNKHERRVQVIDVENSRNILIEGVVLRNTASWTLHVLHSDTVTIRDVKIISDWGVWNADGIDPDSSRNVLIERVFCYTGDDAIAVKATLNSGLLQPSYNIVSRDCVVMTRKTALKVGTETRADISNVLFENIDVVHSSRCIGLWARDGGTIANIIWRDLRIDLVEVPREGRSGQPFYIMAKRRGGNSRVENVRITNVSGTAPWYSLLEADTPWPLSDIRFENIDLTVLPRDDKQDVKHLFEFEHCEGIEFHDITVDFSKANLDQWAGLWTGDAPVVAEDVERIGLSDR